MMHAVKQRAELYDDWASLVTETLEAKLEKKKGKQHEQIRKQSITGPHRWFKSNKRRHENIAATRGEQLCELYCVLTKKRQSQASFSHVGSFTASLPLH